ncbi:MAG: cytochrome c oxidase subunit II [Chloroflexi bacterium]|nr:cytochrome c oxidase subunit II [Chloroflexota bacterium]
MVHFVIVGILVIISTYFVFNGLVNADLLPEQASLQAEAIDELFNVEWFFIAFFFSLIVVFLLYSIVVFRRKPGEEGDGDHIEGNTKLEIVWTVIPLGIVIYLAILGAQTLGKIEARDPNALEINVVASRWTWSFEYPEYGVTSAELALPVDRQVLLRMRSTDVIHSFWVPEFRVKQDVLPGGEAFVRELRLTPSEIGEYKLRCAELCGLQHTGMIANVVVTDAFGFNAWVMEQTGCEDSEEVCAGFQWAGEYGCTSCHTIDGTASIGPTWRGLFGSNVPLEGGASVVADENFIRESILDPDAKIHEGYLPGIMSAQNFADRLSAEQIEELIAFIKSLE